MNIGSIILIGSLLMAVGSPLVAAEKAANTGGLEVRGLTLRENGKLLVLKGLETGDVTGVASEVLTASLATAAKQGANVVKMNAFRVAKDEKTSLPGGFAKFDEALLLKLDAAVAAAKKADLKVLLTLSNDTLAARYASWAGSANPGVFYTDFNCREGFEGYVKTLLARVNTLTKKTYSQESSIIGWVLVDDPSNGNGEPKDVERWVLETSAFVKKLSPHQAVILSLDPAAKGVQAAKMVAQPGVDLVLLKADAITADQFAQSCGRPVVNRDSTGNSASAGNLVPWPDAGQALPTALKSIGAVSVAETSDLFSAIVVTAGPAPYRVLEGKAVVKATLTSPAKISVRYGLKGLLDQETTPTQDPAVTLTGLRAGGEYTLQVKGEGPGGKVSFSDRRILKMPEVARAIPKATPSFSGNFIKVENGRFTDGGKPFRWVGTNNYYLHLTTDPIIDSVFADCNKIGFTVMRTWAFGCTDQVKETYPGEMDRYFVLGPGKWREKSFQDLDRVVASARKHKVRLILPLANNWTDYGGAETWAKYFGYKDKNDFFDKPEVKQAFKDYMKYLVNRKNTITGVAYKDDPIILAWDLMNEPRYERDESGKTLTAWCDEMAKALRAYGVKQLITTGGEGPLGDGKHYSGADFVSIHQPASIDFATYHIYPASEWARWSQAGTKFVIEEHVRLAREVLKKPVVMEEYGVGTNDPKYDRPVFIDNMTKDFLFAGGDGLNYWMLIDPSYQWGDGNDFSIKDGAMCNIFTLAGNSLLTGK